MATIAHIVSGLEQGGAEHFLTSVITHDHLASFEHRVVSLRSAGFFGPPLTAAGVPVDTLDLRLHTLPAGLSRLRRLMRQINPDLVQGWMYHGNLAASLAARWVERPVPVLWNIRHSVADPAREPPGIRLLIRAHGLMAGKVSCCLFNSEAARRHHQELGLTPPVTMVIPNGVDTDRFRPDIDRRSALRTRLRLSADDLVVGHVGRWHPMKNQRGLIDAVRALRSSHPGLQLVLVGRGVTEAHQSAGVAEPWVHCLPATREIERLYPGFDLFCLPSLWGEAWPNALAEAMACGVPALARAVGDSDRILGDPDRLIEGDRSSDIAVAVERMLSLPQARRVELGQRDRARIVAEYPLSATARAYADLYRRMLDDFSKPS